MLISVSSTTSCRCLKKKISDEKYFENLYKELVKGD
jgi:hypothetical protein